MLDQALAKEMGPAGGQEKGDREAHGGQDVDRQRSKTHRDVTGRSQREEGKELSPPGEHRLSESKDFVL